MDIKRLIQLLPKAELHLHIEGSLEPELMMTLATRNQVDLPYNSVEEINSAYQFEDLQSFLDLYYLGASVLKTEDDYYQLMWQYLTKCKAQNIVHAEIMFDPQTHTERGIGYAIFMSGFARAIEQAKAEWGMSVYLILSFLRHLSEQAAFETLTEAKPYLHMVKAVGLDSSESGNPPEKFKNVFAKASELGLLRVAHAGEEGPAAYIWQALDLLKVDRIDHGVRCIEDNELVEELIDKQVPLTVCPLSNVKLCVYQNMRQHNILTLLEKGVMVTVNSDDPSYFGGYLNENFLALHSSLNMQTDQLLALCQNSFKASFLPPVDKQHWIQQCERIAQDVKG